MMITSLFFGACFLIMATRKDRRVKVVAGICLAYLFLENSILFLFEGLENFDITLYLSLTWVLDFLFLFCLALVSKGLRQTLILILSVPLVLVQVFPIQYPSLFPDWVYVFSIQSAYRYFIEVLIFIYSWKDTTVQEWIRTGTVLGLLSVSHLV